LNIQHFFNILSCSIHRNGLRILLSIQASARCISRPTSCLRRE